MTTTKHTPGPWLASKYPRSNAYVVTTTPGDAKGDIANVLFGLGSKIAEETEANARLIAAAPELLEAAIEALPYINADPNDPAGPVARLVAAIAKSQESGT